MSPASRVSGPKCGWHPARREPDLDGGSRTRSARDPAPPAHHLRSLADGGDAEMTRPAAPQDLGIHADPVVADPEEQPALALLEEHVHAVRPGVALGV